jgi:cytochrome c-type biogenesis protein CcmE
MTRKQKRIAVILGGVTFLAGAAALVLTALQQEIVFFRSPTDLVEQTIAPGERLRVGGLVETGSIVRSEGTKASFIMTDNANTVKIAYDGILPDLFREGQGIIAEGRLGTDGVFVADTVLAKHDENYMPKEVADSLKEKGLWNEGNPQPGS